MDGGGNGIRDLERALRADLGGDPGQYLAALTRAGISLDEQFNTELEGVQLYFKRLLLGYAKLKLPLEFGKEWFGIPYEDGEAPRFPIESDRFDPYPSRGSWRSYGTVEQKDSLLIILGSDSRLGHNTANPTASREASLRLIPENSIEHLPAGLYVFLTRDFEGRSNCGNRVRQYCSPDISTAYENLENYIQFRDRIVLAIDKNHDQQMRYLA